jgi:hypothetical protein
VRSRQCRQTGAGQVCRVMYAPQSVNISQSVGIEVHEVSTLSDAMKYFA